MEVPKRLGQRWDGDTKYYTSDCEECDFYREVGDGKLCGWGVAFKYLIKLKKSRKCEVRNRPIKGNFTHHSLEYLDSFIKTDGFKNRRVKKSNLNFRIVYH